MKLGYDLVIEQAQKLSLTPELIQSIQILQLSNFDLIEYVKSELVENPILENAKSLDETQPIDIQEKLRESDFEAERFRQFEYSADDEEDHTYEQYVSRDETLTDHLLLQLSLSKIKSDEAAIGRYIIEAIDDNGYLTMSLEEVAEALGEDIEKVDHVLDVIQNFDPVGVGARDLRECLVIQLSARGMLTDEIEYVIYNMLEELANKKFAVIAKQLGLKKEDVQELSDLIKTLDPKPGRAYGSGKETNYIVPDIILENHHGEFELSSNFKSSPKLRVSSYYDKLVQEAAHDGELKKYINEKFNSAVWLIKSIEQRRRTIYDVSEAIFKHQEEFFQKGEKYLKPLTLRQIAEELGIHESTVSRTINGKYIQSPRGIYELKYFFSTGISTGDGGSVSSSSIKSVIKDLIKSEDEKKPYSDQEIADILKRRDIEISRRTVAKYRESLGILSSSKRKRF
ncbi:MAG: RNA polymerase factor sigma-54 [Clostridia bacterium]|nr:RNA polymerase factor sigma-54 [Clostridia bacterium]